MRYKRLLNIFLSIILIIIVLNTFFFTIVKVDSNFTKKKYLLVNKFYYGPRIPVTPLSLPLSWGKVYSEIIQLKPRRIELKDIRRNHVIAFNYPEKVDLPIDKRPVKIGRVIALPGEEIYIRNTKVKINNKNLDEDISLIYKYRVTCDSIDFPEKLKEKYQIRSVEFVSHPWVYDVIMSNTNAALLINESEILNVRRINKIPGNMNYAIYPHNNFFPWNEDNFGPLLVPAKGTTIEFNFKNYYLYRDIIEIHEQNRIYIEREKILCNGREIKNYTFNQDYFFVLNDNRVDGKDSRYWGFIPKNHIVGKAINY